MIMSFLVVMIVDDPDNCPAILESWERIGITGVTILESTGLGRLRRSGLLDNFPILPSLEEILGRNEVRHRTLLSVVDSQSKVDQMVKAAQEVTGGLEAPNTGILFVLPVLQVYGLVSSLDIQE
jgi:nitrogen regulatory protein P-II 1